MSKLGFIVARDTVGGEKEILAVARTKTEAANFAAAYNKTAGKGVAYLDGATDLI